MNNNARPNGKQIDHPVRVSDKPHRQLKDKSWELSVPMKTLADMSIEKFMEMSDQELRSRLPEEDRERLERRDEWPSF